MKKLKHNFFAFLKTYQIFIAAIIFMGLIEVGDHILNKRTEEFILFDLENSIENILSTSQTALKTWYDHERATIDIWAGTYQLIDLTQKLLAMPRDSSFLNHAKEQHELRAFLKPVLQAYGYEGFFIIAPDSISIGSSRDGNIGTINLTIQQPNFFLNLMQGKTTISLPMESDVPLLGPNNELITYRPTMFSGGAIFDKNQKIIAYILFRINPYLHFSEILQRGHVGDTGDTFAFNRDEFIISCSRFAKDSSKIMNAQNQSQPRQMNSVMMNNDGQNADRMYSQLRVPPIGINIQNQTKGMNLGGYINNRNKNVIGGWIWLEELGFGLLTETEKDEVFRSIRLNRFADTMMFIVTSLFMIIYIILYTISRKSDFQTKNQLQSIINNTTALIYIKDIDGKYLLLNDQFKNAFNIESGKRSTEILNSTIHREFCKNNKEREQKVINSGLLHESEKKIIIKNKTRYFIQTLFPLYDQSAKKYAVCGILTDITKIKKTEKDLRMSEQYNRSLFESSPIGLALTDLKGNFIDVNQAFANIIGKNVDEIKSLAHWDFIPTEYSEHEYIIRKTITTKDRFGPYETYYLHEKGETVPVRLSGMINEVWDKKYLWISAEDISDRKNIEQALRESEENARILLNTSDDAIMLNNADGTILDVNDSMAERFSYKRSDMIGKSMVDLLPADILKDGRHSFRTIGKTGKPLHNITNEDGQFFETSVYPMFDDDGQLRKTAVYRRNITEQKQIEQAILKTKDEAEAANKAKSEFLARMSHEIRTPMNAILGMAHLVMQTELTDKQQDYLTKVHRAAHTLLGIINRILDFSKIEAEQMQLEHVCFEMDDVISHVSDIIGEKIHEKGLEYRCNRSEEVPKRFIGDPLRLGQILVNLTNNALKFTAEGHIELKISVEKRMGSKMDVRFSVIDTGIGMSKDQQKNIFKPFVQADGSTSRHYGGTGLGLAISYELVTLMGGTISVESDTGKGCTFSFTIPLEIEAEANNSITFNSFSQYKILVVDDNEYVLGSIQQILNPVLKAEFVSSGEQAIHLVRENNIAQEKAFDLVIIDWKMPNMDGLETIENIRWLPDLYKIPEFAIMTGFDKVELSNKARYLGLQHILTKPILQSSFLDMMQSLFKPATSQQEKKVIALPKKNANILLIEDDIINQEVAREMLKGEGCIVEIANDGSEAVELLNDPNYDNRFDLVFMDLQMPVLDGYQATIKIRENQTHNELPIVALTADAIVGVRQRCLEVGMDDIITKPIDPVILIDTLHKMLAKKVIE